MSHVTLAELRQKMAHYLDTAVADRKPLVVTRPTGRGNVVILGEDEFEALQETVHLLNSPANAARLLASVAQLKAGGTHERALIEPAAARKPA